MQSSGQTSASLWLYPLGLGKPEDVAHVMFLADQPDDAAEHLGRKTIGHVELIATRIHPHVGVSDMHVRIARKAVAFDVKQGRQTLVRDLHIDEFE